MPSWPSYGRHPGQSMSPEERSEELARLAPRPNAPLTELQTWMTALIRHRKALHKNAALIDAAALHFGGNERLSPAEQINIYRVQFWLRHTGILIDHFDGLSRFMGQSRWQRIAESYLERADTAVFALSDLGNKMAEHLASLPAFPHQRLCTELAELEWAYQCAFSAADDPVLSVEKLQSIAPEAWPSASFLVSDSLQLLTLHYPVADLRRELRSQTQHFDLDQFRERAQTLTPEDLHLVVYRRERVLYDKVLSKPAFLLLAELKMGTPLIPACEAVMNECPEAETVFEEQLMHWFSLWGKLSWIVDVIVE